MTDRHDEKARALVRKWRSHPHDGLIGDIAAALREVERETERETTDRVASPVRKSPIEDLA